jgi:glycosyltransferase involved in cell wall biosynthesis
VRFAWLVSRYPALSHTFIRREIGELRRRGLAIETFTLRRPPERELLNEEDRAESRATFAILPAPPLALIAAHVAALLRRPLAWLACLAAAFEGVAPRPKAWLWRIFHFAEAIRLARELERRGIGHLHVHFADAGAEAGRLAAKWLAIPWSLTLHGFADLNPAAIGALRRLVASARFAVCISDFTRAAVAGAVDPADAAKLHVVRCGLDVGALDSRGPQPPRPRAGRVRLLCVGRLAPEKEHALLVDAFADAVAAGLDGELAIVGGGPERATIERRIAERAIAARVRLAGAKSEAELAVLYGDCDLFVLSSRMEGIPVVLMEAMARSIAVVAPRVGGIPELVQDGQSGLLFTPMARGELAEALARAGRDAALRARLGAAARARVAALHSLEKSIEPLLALLTAATAAPAPKPEPRAAAPRAGAAG